MDLKKVLFISQELDPYLPDTPLGVYNRNVAQSFQESGAEVRTFMPKYGAINERRNQLHEVIRLSGLNIVIDDTDHPLIIKVATMQPSRLQVYFIDNDDYFSRHTPSRKLEIVETPACNDERAMFFVRGVIETVKKLRWEPELVYCTGWITALVPFYLKHVYNEDIAFVNSKLVLGLVNDSFEGDLDDRMIEKLKDEGFTDEQLALLADGDGYVDYAKLCKLAINNVDAVIEAAEGVLPEIIEYAKASGKPFLPWSVASQLSSPEYKQFLQSL